MALIVTFTALTIYHGWTLFRANERIKNYLVSKIRPVLGEKCDIEYLDMALGAVHLKGVQIESNNSYYSLYIEDLRIGYNLVNLIKNGFKPQKSPQDILFVNPQLIIKYQPHKDSLTTDFAIVDSLENGNGYHDYLDKARNFDFLKRITISKGSIVYIDSLDTHTTLANDISGWISTRDLKNAKARMVGKIFHSNQLNLRLDGEIDLIREKLGFLKLNLINFQWRERIPFFIPPYLDIQQGLINGNIVVTEFDNDAGFDVNGDITIKDGAFRIKNKNLFVTDINLDAEIKNWDFVINKSEQQFNGSMVEIGGGIKNILNPEFNLNVFSREFDIGEFQTYLQPDAKIRFAGDSELNMSILNSYKNPKLTAQLNCPRLKIDKHQIDDVGFTLSYKDSVIQVKHFHSKHQSKLIKGDGQIDFSDPEGLINFQLTVDGKLAANFNILNVNSLANSECHAQLNLWGHLNEINGKVRVECHPVFQDSSSMSFVNHFQFKENLVTFSMTSEQIKMNIDGAANFQEKEHQYQINFRDVHEFLYQLPEYKSLKKPFDFKKSNIEVYIQPNRTDIFSTFEWKDLRDLGYRKSQVNIWMRGPEEKRRITSSLNAIFGKQHYEGAVTLVKENEMLNINEFKIENILSATGKIDLASQRAIQGKVIFQNSDLNHIYNLFTLDPGFINQGNVNGEFTISGTVDNPALKGTLNIRDSYINGVGIYDGDVNIRYAGKDFSIDQLALRRNGVDLFTGKGGYFSDSSKVDIRLSGRQVDLNVLMQSLTEQKDLIAGEADANLRLIGAPDDLQITGDIEVGAGNFSRFAFDSMYATLGRSKENVSSSAGISLKEFSINRKNQFIINGDGFIPFSSLDTMDIRLNGTGNLLSILPEITNFFKDTRSDGKWDVHFTGSPGNLSIASGYVNLQNGFLELGAVAPKIDDISVKLIVEPDGFVKVDYIKGKVKKREFSFFNNKAPEVCCQRNLLPFVVPDFGLDFGVWSIKTTEKGVPLHIPALMEKGEIGNFEFIGRDSCENFYVAGPAENPVLRGKIKLRNVNLMYPFAETPGMAESPVTRLLQLVEWDVLAVAGKDTRYEKEIPSGVDKVYVNLLLDSGVGGLDFSGIIDEQSFAIEGKVESTNGNVDYLDFDFRVEKAGIEFDKSNLLPMVYGNAKVTVADSLGVPHNIFLTLLLEDEESGHVQTRGRWGKIQFKLTTDNPNIGITEGEILASLGYSASNIREKATDIIGISTDNYLFRPLFRPFERQLERTFNLDLVRFSSRFTRNLIEMNLWSDEVVNNNSKLYLLRSSRVMVGKYLADRVFFSYTGQLESNMSYRQHGEQLGLKHRLGLEYRINSNLLLEMEYNYNSFLIQREDKRIFLRHSFPIQ